MCLFCFNELYNSAGWGGREQARMMSVQILLIQSFSSDFPAVSVVDVEDRQGGRGRGPRLRVFPAQVSAARLIAALESLKLTTYTS